MFAHFIPQIYMQDNRQQPVIELRYHHNNNNKNKINHKKTSAKTRLSSIA